MGKRFRRASFLLVASVLTVGLWNGKISNAGAQSDASWLVNAGPTLSKVVDLPANTPPDAHNTDCIDMPYTPVAQPTQILCSFDSPLGKIAEGRLVLGPNRLSDLYGTSRSTVFIPSGDASRGLVSVSSSQTGNYLGVYTHLTKTDLRQHIGNNGGTYYDVATAPDMMLRNPATGKMLAVNMNSMAFSASGEWMITDVPQVGLLRVHMTDLGTQLFSQPLEPSWYLGLATISLAISDDGRYAAANTDLFGTGNVSIYDLSTCSDQLDVVASQRQYCAGKDIWHGGRMDIYAPGEGVLSQQPSIQQPTHIRFINDDTVSFNARYTVTAPTHYMAATFVATAPGAVQHKIGLLGLGDSYISGQGEFVYREGTDIQNNTCHLSELSYPFTLGAEYFDSYNSIACSGAKTNDVITMDNNYKGQVKDGEKWKDRKNKDQVTNEFMPGFAGQVYFDSAYLPEAMLLSVGGDDVGFADIVKACVANAGGGTCYDTYEDRAELVNEINATYSKLVTTYTTLREQSGGARLYVVGYPQIAKAGGNCGLNVHLNGKELGFAAQLIDYLDGVVQKAAATAGVFYVDTQHAFDGHRLCESGDKAMNGVTMGNDAGVTILGHTINFIGTETYHPTQLGYQLLAQAIAEQTDGLAALMPVAKPYLVPAFDPTAPILQNLIHTGRKINLVTNDDTIANDFMLRGDHQQVIVEGKEVQLRPKSKYDIVLHSTPILLDEGGVDAAGNISTTVRIPTDVTLGFHTLHIYGTDMAGNSVDIQKVVYIAADLEDYDGDGMVNSASACSIFPASSQDIDGDGIDDACDAEITAPVARVPAEALVSANSASIPLHNSTSATQAVTLGNVQLEDMVLGDTVTLAATDVNHSGLSATNTQSTAVGPGMIRYRAWSITAVLVALLYLGIRRAR